MEAPVVDTYTLSPVVRIDWAATLDKHSANEAVPALSCSNHYSCECQWCDTERYWYCIREYAAQGPGHRQLLVGALTHHLGALDEDHLQFTLDYLNDTAPALGGA